MHRTNATNKVFFGLSFGNAARRDSQFLGVVLDGAKSCSGTAAHPSSDVGSHDEVVDERRADVPEQDRQHHALRVGGVDHADQRRHDADDGAKIHFPVFVIDALTGSVAMNTSPKAAPPITRCQYHGTPNIGLVSLRSD